MSAGRHPDVADIPADLDRFLGNFFSRRGWRSEIKYDPDEDRLYLDIRLADTRLSADDRFLSLLEYFARAQSAVLRRRTGLPLRCRVFSGNGDELTTTLHARGSSYLDDDERGATMRRRLRWLSFRRRLVRRILPSAALWATALFVVVNVIGIPLVLAMAVAVAALTVQAITLYATAARTS